jgi:XTP/dITP diphosphohydrolase
MRKLLIATTNNGKLQEIRGILAGLTVELLSLEAFPGVAEPEETGATFAENARLKALYYADQTGLPVVADDSGIEIDALGSAPGVHSARWHGNDYPAKFAAIYRELAARGLATDPVRGGRHGRGGDRPRAGGHARLRLRSHLFLPSLRMHAGGGRG